jgi:bifunctional DNA-binding transcriptional regulator/antitoxin component of YhaV-PrlF toxin-antitoxin module
MALITRTTDKKGRITLPKEFADHLVIIEHVAEGEVRIRKAQAIPASEAWLWQNPEAAAKLLSGLQDARAGKLADGPDLDADASRFGIDED